MDVSRHKYMCMHVTRAIGTANSMDYVHDPKLHGVMTESLTCVKHSGTVPIVCIKLKAACIPRAEEPGGTTMMHLHLQLQ